MVVRELVAVLGMKTDTGSFKRAESAMDRIKSAAVGIGAAWLAVQGAMRAGAVFAGFFREASSAQETLNLLGLAFGENSQKVLDWADSFSKAAGRSRFELRKMAGDMGALLNPLLDQDTGAAAEMSTKLSEVAIDLASAMDKTDKEVMDTIRSGISGETEPMKRLGINLTVESLEQFGKAAGFKKSFKAMTIREKTELRYAAILQKTKFIQGDAANTAKFYANAVKALGARFKDFAVEVGLRMMPVMESIVATLIELADTNGWLADALGRTGRAIAKLVDWGLKLITWVWKMLGYLTPFQKSIFRMGLALMGIIRLLQMGVWGKWALWIAAIVLLVDDFMTFMEGGDSVIGRINDKLKVMTGIDLKEFFESLGVFVNDLEEAAKGGSTLQVWGALWDEMVLVMQGYLDAAWQEWSNLWNDSLNSLWNDFMQPMALAIAEGLTWISDKFTDLGDWIQGVWDSALEGLKEMINTANKWLNRLNPFSKGEAAPIFDTTGEKAKDQKGPAQKDPTQKKKFDFPSVDAIKKYIANLPEDKRAAASRLANMAVKTGVATIGGQSFKTMNVPNNQANNSTTFAPQTKVDITVKGAPGMSAADIGKASAEEVQRVLDSQNRQAMQVIGARAAG